MDWINICCLCTMVGVGFTWNIFDGFESRNYPAGKDCWGQMLHLGKEKAITDLGGRYR